MDSIICLLPPVLAIVLAFATKSAYIALLAGLYSAVVIISGGDFIGSILPMVDDMFGVFANASNVKMFADLILVSGLMSLIERSGGIAGFIDLVSVKNNLIRSKKDATILTWLVGVAVFFSDNLSCIITGAVTKDINKSFKMSREKMAYIVHSTSTAVCLLLPLGGWGAYCAALLDACGVENSMGTMIKSIPLNFFCLIVVFSIPVLALIGKDFGPMKKAELRAETDPNYYNEAEGDEDENAALTARKSSCANVLVPVALLIAFIILGMFITGNGSFFNGDGGSALLYANVLTILITIIMYKRQKLMTTKEAVSCLTASAGNTMPMILILIFAFAFSGKLSALGTATYISDHLLANVPTSCFAMLVLLVGMALSFATGSSMSAITIMAPLTIPAAMSLGISVPLVAGAVWGGAVFGDQSSPISDTTFLTCSTMHCKPIEHTKTQLPYTLTAAALAAVLYLVFGLFM